MAKYTQEVINILEKLGTIPTIHQLSIPNVTEVTAINDLKDLYYFEAARQFYRYDLTRLIPMDLNDLNDFIREFNDANKLLGFVESKNTNVFIRSNAILGGYYNYTTGVWTANAANFSTDYIPCVPGYKFTFSRGGHITFWDANHSFISGVNIPSNSSIEYIIPSVANIAYFKMSGVETGRGTYYVYATKDTLDSNRFISNYWITT